MKEILLQLAGAYLGALGFSLLFGLHKRHLFLAALGGMMSWGVRLLVQAFVPISFLSDLAASVFAVAFSELMAHWRKCPATLFVVPAIIPLVPGSSLYYAMSCAVRNDLSTAHQYAQETLISALAIAAGISFVTVCRELRSTKEKTSASRNGEEQQI